MVLPAFAPEPFDGWFARYERGRRENGAGSPEGEAGREVVLFDDTYLRYHEPRIGEAAVRLLASAGYRVTLARAGCCQRPRISHGFLRDAKRAGTNTLRALAAHVERGCPVVVVEPGCASALLDDLPDLVDDAALGDVVRSGTTMIDVFLARELAAGRIASPDITAAPALAAHPGRVMIHGHCHQKSLFGTGAMRSLLGRVAGIEVEDLDAGCCGMAGSFGYEKEHYDLSMRIGEDRLFPALRARGSESTVIACGFSCRHQIEHATGIHPVHWVETLTFAGVHAPRVQAVP